MKRATRKIKRKRIVEKKSCLKESVNMTPNKTDKMCK